MQPMTDQERLAEGVKSPVRPNRSKASLRRRSFRLLALLVGLAPFVVFELALIVLDVGKSQSYRDPFVGFSRDFPLFELDSASGEYHTSRSKLNYFAPQRFAAKKPQGSLRIFCLGGSTVLGHPYQPQTAFSTWLKLELEGQEPGRVAEAVNCGGISYASYRLVPILQQVLNYQPDLVIVASGHNEFLEDRTYEAIRSRSQVETWLAEHLLSLRTVTLARRGIDRVVGQGDRSKRPILKAEVDARLDHPSGYASYHRDDAWREAVILHFRQNLHAMVRLCRQAKVPLVLVNLGSNLRDCPPFKSEHRAGITIEALEQWQQHVSRGSAIDARSPKEALAFYRQAEAIDGEHALLVYRIARCLDRLQRYDEARQAYVRAKELDVCPVRALEAINEAVVAIAEETGTPLVDARWLLHERSPEGITGYNWYIDQVHPSIAGHQLIAQAIAEELFRRQLANRSASWTKRSRRAAYREQLQQLGEKYLREGEIRVGWLENWARRDRLREETRPDDARSLLDAGHTSLDFGKSDSAKELYQSALSLDPGLCGRLFDHALILFQQGRTGDAEQVLGLLRESSSDANLLADVETALLLTQLEMEPPQLSSEQREKLASAIADPTPHIERWLEEVPDARGRLHFPDMPR